MKFLVQSALVMALAYGGYLYYDLYLRAEPPVVEVPETPDSGHRIITCPTCEGEGRLTFVDRRGQNHSYACKVCGFTGSRTLYVPPDTHVCADCEGMGRYASREPRGDSRSGYVIGATRCQRCAATGLIRPQWAPGRQERTFHL